MWEAIDFKLGSAEFFFGEMSKDLIPPRSRPENQTLAAIAASTGALVGHPWEPRFYYHLDAFLAVTRSIPDVILWCFGRDSRAGNWFKNLSAEEKERRESFQAEFEDLYLDFSKLNLSRARKVTMHRTGIPPVEINLTGRWGENYVGSPVMRVPSCETMPLVEGENLALLAAVNEVPLPVEPRFDDFELQLPSGAKKKLFPECAQYLSEARSIVEKAKVFSDSVHGGKKLTAPPSA